MIHSANTLTEGEKMKQAKKIKKFKSHIYNSRYKEATEMLNVDNFLIWKVSTSMRDRFLNKLGVRKCQKD